MFCCSISVVSINFANIQGKYGFAGVAIQKFLSFVFSFKFMTNWCMKLHFYMILYHKKPIAHVLLPDETQVETQYIKFKVTPDKMVNFAFHVSK